MRYNNNVVFYIRAFSYNIYVYIYIYSSVVRLRRRGHAQEIYRPTPSPGNVSIITTIYEQELAGGVYFQSNDSDAENKFWIRHAEMDIFRFFQRRPRPRTLIFFF